MLHKFTAMSSSDCRHSLLLLVMFLFSLRVWWSQVVQHTPAMTSFAGRITEVPLGLTCGKVRLECLVG